jgi:hypothetical protein
MTSTFDYKAFAQDLTKQAETSMPNDIALQHKKEFLERIYNFTYIAGEAFSKDEKIEDVSTAKLLTQLISEWTFHKYIDLIRSNIPAMYHESILQKLGYVAYEMSREATISKLSNDEMLKLVEVQLNKAYEKSCKQLLENNQITQEIYNNAVTLSNVDMMPHTSEKKKFKTFNYTVVAMCIALITLGMNVFMYDYQNLDVINTVSLVVLSMYMGFYIGVKRFNNI